MTTIQDAIEDRLEQVDHAILEQLTELEKVIAYTRDCLKQGQYVSALFVQKASYLDQAIATRYTLQGVADDLRKVNREKRRKTIEVKK